MSRNIEIPKKTRHNIAFTITDENNDPVDLTAAEEVILRVDTELGEYGSNVAEFTQDTKNSDGVASWNLDNSDTDIKAGLYWYEIEVVYSSTQSTNPYVGRFFIKERVE